MPFAITSFSYGRRIFREGERVSPDDPAVAKFPHLFMFDEQDAQPVRAVVEQATAAPGEVRKSKPRPRKRTAKKASKAKG